MKKCIRNFFVFFLIIAISIGQYPKRSHAAVQIAGGAVAAECISYLIGAALICGGVYVYQNTDSEDIKNMANSIIDSGHAAKDFAIKINNEGKRVLTMTKAGASDLAYYFKSAVKNKFVSGYDTYSFSGGQSVIMSFTEDEFNSFRKSHSSGTVFRSVHFSSPSTYKITLEFANNPWYKEFYTDTVKAIYFVTTYSYGAEIVLEYKDGVKVSYSNPNTYVCNVSLKSEVYISDLDASDLVVDVSNDDITGINSDTLFNDLTDEKIDSMLNLTDDTETFVSPVELPVKEADTDPEPEERPKVFVPSIDFPYEKTIEEIPYFNPKVPYTDPDSDTGEKTDPSTDPGTGGSTDPGTDPGTSGKTDPGTDPGTGGKTDPGTDPGTGGKTDPGTDPGTDGKTDPGTNPGTGEKTDPDGDFTVPDNDVPELDFSPLKIVTRKFPFSIPWDLWSCFKVFEADSQPLRYTFSEINCNLGENTITVIPEFTIDFADYPNICILVTVMKYLLLLLFIVMLVRNTRSNFIRG